MPSGVWRSAAAELHAVKERVFVGDVVVVAGEDVRGVVGFEAHEVGDLVAVEVEDVGDGLALLQEELRAVEGRGEGAAWRHQVTLGLRCVPAKYSWPGTP